MIRSDVSSGHFPLRRECEPKRNMRDHSRSVACHQELAHTGIVAHRVQRFTKSERAVHWLTALAFFSLLLSGLVVGRRGTFHNVMWAWHLASAGVLMCGLTLILLAGNR